MSKWDIVDKGGSKFFRSFSGQIPMYIAGPLVDKVCVETCKFSGSFF